MERPQLTSRPSSSSGRPPSLLPSAIPRDPGTATSADRARNPPSRNSLEEESTRLSGPPPFSRETSGGSDDPAGFASAAAHPSAHEHPGLASFFTIIEDVRNGTAHNPAVRYVFVDDDGEGLTDTLLRLNAPSGGSAATSRTVTRKTAPTASSSEADRHAASSNMPVRDRAVVVTLTEDGRGVASAHSLAGDWQVLDAEITTAPTLHGNVLEGETGGLMLRISGTEGFPNEPAANETARAAEGDTSSLEAAVERYRERMDELRRVMEASQYRE